MSCARTISSKRVSAISLAIALSVARVRADNVVTQTGSNGATGTTGAAGNPGGTGGQGGAGGAVVIPPNFATPDPNIALGNGGSGGAGGNGGSGSVAGANGGAGGIGGTAGIARVGAQSQGASGLANASATAHGGTGGAGGFGGPGYAGGPMGNGGDAAPGGTAFATATASNTTADLVNVNATSIGGLGGVGGIGLVAGRSGDGGVASLGAVTGISTGGGPVSVVANQMGGNGGGTVAVFGVPGGTGASSALNSSGLNSAIFASTSGNLYLRQYATAGAGGASWGNSAGSGGDANSSLSFMLGGQPLLSGEVGAWGGSGGTGQQTPGGAGGNATASLTLVGSGNVSASAIVNSPSVGGNGGDATPGVDVVLTAPGANGGAPGQTASAAAVGISSPFTSGPSFLTVSAVSHGGRGGAGYGPGFHGADGAPATASATGRSSGSDLISVSASAFGGNGGHGSLGAAGGSGADASATASGGGNLAPAVANATAVGGAGGGAESGAMSGQLGNATATAGAGGMSSAMATASAMGNAVHATAQAQVQSIAQPITEIDTQASGQATGTQAQARAIATISGLVPDPSATAGLQTAALAAGMPDSTSISQYIGPNSRNAAANPKASSVFLTYNGNVIGLNLMGASYAPRVAGAQYVYSTSVSYDYGTSGLSFPRNLEIALLDPLVSNDGFQSLHFQIAQPGSTLLDQTFTSAPAAQEYFTDHVLTFGNTRYNQTLTFSMDLTTDHPSGFSAEIVLGNGGIPGDLNGDGAVNFSDVLSLVQGYGQTGFGAKWANGDINGDGIVNFADALLLVQHYGESLSPDQLAGLAPASQADTQRGFATVPEPTSFTLLCLTASALWPRRRTHHQRPN